MPPFAFDDHPVRLPARFVPCNVPHWPAVPIANTSSSEDVLGVAFDGQGGAFVLTIELSPAFTHTALRLGYVTPAGVARIPIDVDRPGPGGPSHWYYAAIASLGTGKCAVAWGDLRGTFQIEGFDDRGIRLFSSQLAPASGAPRLPAIETRGNGVVVAFFHSGATARVLQLRFVTAAGIVSWTGLEWQRAGAGFNNYVYPQIVTGPTGEVGVFWIEPSVGPPPIFAQRVASNGQSTGPPTVVATTGEPWFSPAVRRVVTDSDGGAYVGSVDVAGQLTLVRIIRPRPGQLTPAFWTAPIARLGNRSAFSLAADGDSGAALIACIGANGRLSAHRVDAQGNDAWIAMGAHDITGLSIQLMMGAFDDFFSHAVAIAPNGTGGALVMYHDVATSVSEFSNDVRSGLFYACIDPNGRAAKRRAEITSARFPAHMLVAPAGQDGAVVAWQDHLASVSDTNVFAQMIDCCAENQPEVYPWPPRPFRGIPVGLPLLPEHLQITLPARRGESGYFGFLGVPQLARIPGVVLPGGLTTPDMPRPDWVRISFFDLQRDFTIELFTHRGDSVGRAEPLQRSIESLPPGALSKQITFRPTHAGVYILGIGYEGADFSPGERHLARVSVEFGDDAPDGKKRARRRATRGVRSPRSLRRVSRGGRAKKRKRISR